MMTDKTHRGARSLGFHWTRGTSMVEPINDRFLEKGCGRRREWVEGLATTYQ